MNHQIKYTVIGAGHGGKAMAAHLALMGFPTTLYNRTPEHIAAIKELGVIDLESNDGTLKGFGHLEKVTSNMEEALEEAKVINVVVPSSAHADIARASAPFLKDGQIVVLHPGRTCGAIEFSKVIRENGCTADVTIAEAETFIYASRSDGPAQARIFRIKEAVPLAALPATRNRLVLDTLREAYPEFIDGGNVWIESTHGDYQFYIDGVTPSVSRVLEALDRERVTVASSLGIRARTGLEWLYMAYNSAGEDLYEAIHNQPGYYGIKAPPTLNHRYLFEDVPMSLVPIAALGQRYGVEVRGMDAMIRLASIIHHTDYWRRGRTLDKLGISQLSVGELMHFVMEGTLE